MEISVLGNMNFKGKFSVSKLDAFPATASAGELVVVQDRLWHNQEIAPNRLAWVPLTEDKTYHIHNQPDLSAQWIVTHNFGILGDIDLSVYDNAGKPISYANLVVVSENQVAVNFTEPKLGTAVMYVSERIAAKLIAANSVKIGDLLVREQDMKLLIGGTEASLKGHTHEMSEINGLMTEINLLKSSAGLSPNPSLNSLTVTNDIKVWQGQNGGWRDIISEVNARASGSNSPTFTRLGTSPFYAYKFAVDTECWMNFHLNHDYAPGTAVFPHVHYTTDGTATIPIRWEFAIAVAKGHGQEAFNVPTPRSARGSPPLIARFVQPARPSALDPLTARRRVVVTTTSPVSTTRRLSSPPWMIRRRAAAPTAAGRLPTIPAARRAATHHRLHPAARATDGPSTLL